MGEVGVETVEAIVPKLRTEKQIDLVIAQAENVTEGKGITPKDLKRLQSAGVDFCTGGNWSLHQPDIAAALADPNQPIIRPANYPHGTAGLGYKYAHTKHGDVLVISLLGNIVGKDAESPMDNPLQVVDAILSAEKETPKVGIVVNLHGDFSSQKIVIGHYLDGVASLVVGDHWHVPTADARVLPKRTAHITDVGMCGVLNASLGVEFSSVIPRWRDGKQTKNVLATAGPRQFNAVLATIGADGLAESIEQIQRTV